MDWGSAIVAGVLATAVMTILMYLGKAMGMPMDMPRMLGLMFVGPGSGAVTTLGLVAHVMMGVIFAIIYGLLFNLFGIAPRWAVGSDLRRGSWSTGRTCLRHDARAAPTDGRR